MNKISGIFISLSESESTEIFNLMERSGYDKDAAGIKNFLLDYIKEAETPEKTPVENFIDSLQKNPQIIFDTAALIRNIIKKPGT